MSRAFIDFSAAGLAAKSVSHGLIGGALAHAQGGQFGHGFMSSGVTAASTPYISNGFDGNRFLQGAMAATVGGTVSEVTGGKFANGAVTSAMAFAFNQLASGDDQEDGYREYDPNHKKIHDGTVFTLACDASQQFGCSPGYVFESGLMYHPAPGFDGSAPVRNLDIQEVPGFGDVRFHVFESEMRIVNATMPGHKLHPGYVERQVLQIDQRVYIRTRGVGIGPMGSLNEMGTPILWPAVDQQAVNRLHGIYPPTRIVP